MESLSATESLSKKILNRGEKNWFSLDPRTKFLLTISISTICLGSGGGDMLHVIRLFLSGIPFVLLVSCGKKRLLIKSFSVFFIAYLTMRYIVPLTSGIAGFLLVATSGLVMRMLPCIAMGYYMLATTSVSEFIAAAERMHVSEKIIIPLSVMFRFFPTIHEEYGHIKNAMKMRGISNLRHPLEMLEYRIVPLMMSVLKIGEELSAAALTRGLGGPVKRTNICKVGLSAFDVVLMALSLTCTLIYLLVLGGFL